MLPGIVQLKLDYNHLKALSGVKFDGYVTLLCDDKAIKKEFGEILFTDYGISGPPIPVSYTHLYVFYWVNRIIINPKLKM